MNLRGAYVIAPNSSNSKIKKKPYKDIIITTSIPKKESPISNKRGNLDSFKQKSNPESDQAYTSQI